MSKNVEIKKNPSKNVDLRSGGGDLHNSNWFERFPCRSWHILQILFLLFYKQFLCKICSWHEEIAMFDNSNFLLFQCFIFHPLLCESCSRLLRNGSYKREIWQFLSFGDRTFRYTFSVLLLIIDQNDLSYLIFLSLYHGGTSFSV